MKIVNMLLFLIMVSSVSECDQDKEVSKVFYEAFTRGSSYTIEIGEDQIVVHSGLRGATVNKRTVTPEEWGQIKSLAAQISLENMGQMKPGSDKRYSDAAAHARVKVFTEDEVFESPEFDDGNPPAPLQPLVKAMITLAETVE